MGNRDAAGTRSIVVGATVSARTSDTRPAHASAGD